MNGVSKADELLIILGVVPLIALTDSAINTLGISLTMLVIFFLSSLVCSLLPKSKDVSIRFLLIIIVTATMTTIADTIMRIHLTTIYSNAVLFLPLTAVNSFLVYHLRTHEIKRKPFSLATAVSKKFIFVIVVLLTIGIIREIIGKGTLFNQPILTPDPEAKLFVIANSPAGALVITAIILGLRNLCRKKTDE